MGSQKLHDFISEAVRKHHNVAVELSDDLYAHPELPDQEFRSSAKMVDILKAAGYEVEYPYMDYPTAFRAELDNGPGPTPPFWWSMTLCPVWATPAAITSTAPCPFWPLWP